MHDHNHLQVLQPSYGPESLLSLNCSFFKRQTKRISKRFPRYSERNAVLLAIAPALPFVPLETHRAHLLVCYYTYINVNTSGFFRRHHFPMQNELKIRLRMSSAVVAPVISSSGRRAL